MRDRRAIGGQVVTVCSVAGGVSAMGAIAPFGRVSDMSGYRIISEMAVVVDGVT